MTNVIRYTCPNCGKIFRADRWAECTKCLTPVPEEILDAQNANSGPNWQAIGEGSPLPPYARKYTQYGENRSFLAVLFDYTFESFIFVRVARIFYLVALIISSLAFVIVEIALVFSLFSGLNEARSSYYGDVTGYYMTATGWPLVFAILLLPFIYLVEIIILRLSLEAGVALIKIAENTQRD
jgi:hypothetical protein